MPQDGSNNYQYPPGTPGVPDQTIESAKYNAFLDDLVANDLNIPRPLHRGGTGASTADQALLNLKAERASQVVTNYDSHVWMAGSFTSVPDATGSPTGGTYYFGTCLIYNLDQNWITLFATPITSNVTFVRQKVSGVWGAWTQQAGTLAEADARYVNLTGDTMTGRLQVNAGITTLGNGAEAWTYISGNAGGINPAHGGGLGIAWNHSSGGGEVNFVGAPNGGSGVQTFVFHNWNGTTLSHLLSLSALGATLPTDPTLAMHAATKQYADTKLPLAGGTLTGSMTVTGKMTIGGTASQYAALLSARNSVSGVASVEFGHANTAGYGSTLNALSGGGQPYLGFNCGPGTNASTFKTFGIKGSVIQSDLAGGLIFGKIDNASADNQALTNTMSVSTNGAINAGSISVTGNVSGGNISASGDIGATGNVYSGPSTNAGGLYLANNESYFVNQTSQIAHQWFSGYYHVITKVSGTLQYIANNAQIAAWGYTGTYTISNMGYKPGGGDWADSSDIRIKNVEGEYKRGLDEIAQLRPIYYTFKGNDTPEPPANTDDLNVPLEQRVAPKEALTVPYPNSAHAQAAKDRTRYTGLIAQEVEPVFPEMITKRAAYIDGVAVDDLRDLDTTPLIFALVNAIKELKARIEVLEGAA